MAKYALELISPRQRYINYPAHSEMAKLFGKRRLMVPLALPTVAALTPDQFDIRIYDENIEDLPKDSRPDVVGITTLAATARRAFEIADRYRARGARIIFGGMHATALLDEALKHGDAVVAGEAEGNWERCLADFEKGSLKQVYQSDSFAEFKRPKPPRWDLVNMKRIFQVSLQASRGCPFNCDFCMVSKTFGRKVRFRDIDNVVEEIQGVPSRYILFVDDNLTINKRWAKDLCRAIMPLKISWACMSSIDVAEDEELLNLMAESGCFNILIGLESLNPRSLEETNKHQNRRGATYEESIRKIHAMGIHINASFVVGFDHDDLQEFDRIFDFTMKNSLPNVNMHLLGAPPGSETYRKIKEQGRLVNWDLDLGVGHFPIIQYTNGSQLEFFDKYMETVTRFYSFSTIRAKAEALFTNGTFTRPGADIGPWLKARLCWFIFTEFVVSGDRDRRKLFRFILGLILGHRLAVDKGLGFLLAMLGYHRHIQDHHRHMDEYRRMVMSYERGPYIRPPPWSPPEEKPPPVVEEPKLDYGFFEKTCV